MYEHYLRINNDNIITHGYSHAFETPLETDVLIDECEERHFHYAFMHQIVNERGQYLLKYENNDIVERPQQEIDDEWNSSHTPKTEIEVLEDENALIALELIDTQIKLEQVESEQANLLLLLVENEVI